MDKFKVVTKPGDVTAYKGKGESAGVSHEEATKVAKQMNGRAEELGIKTRFEVASA